MKVGDYIRTIKYGIRKIEMVIDEPDRKGVRFNDTDGWNKGVPEEGIIKSSPNIIDLIEENDLVKIEYYAPSYEERITRIFVVDFKNENDIAFENSHCNLNIFDNEWSKHDIKLNPVIKSIITHEQIEDMEYKVKE